MNELELKFWTSEGKLFDVQRGKIDADIGYEGHGMFVMKFKFDWGTYTFGSFLLEKCLDWDVDPKDRVFVTQPYTHDLIKAMLKVCNVDYFSSIKNKEMYLLFNDKDRCPVGLVNIHDIQNSLIFDDIVKPE